MAKLSLNTMLMMVVSLIFITFLLPIGLVHILNIGEIPVPMTFLDENGSAYSANYTLSDVGGDTVIVLLTSLVPLSIAIGIVVYYIKFAT